MTLKQTTHPFNPLSRSGKTHRMDISSLLNDDKHVKDFNASWAFGIKAPNCPSLPTYDLKAFNNITYNIPTSNIPAYNYSVVEKYVPVLDGKVKNCVGGNGGCCCGTEWVAQSDLSKYLVGEGGYWLYYRRRQRVFPNMKKWVDTKATIRKRLLQKNRAAPYEKKV